MNPSPSDHPIVRARLAVLAVFLAACAYLIPGIADLRHDDDVLAFLPHEHPDVTAFEQVAERFGMLELALVGLKTEQGTMFEPTNIDRVRALSEQLSQLRGVRMVLSFVDLPDPKVTPEGLEVAALVPEGLEDTERIRERVLASEDAVGNLISADGEAAALLVYLIHARGDERVQLREQVLDDIERTVADDWVGSAYFGGAPFSEHEAATASRRDIERLSPVVIVVLAVASAVMLGSATAATLNLLLAGVGVALIMGAHGRLDEPLTIVSSTTPVMMVAFGGAFGVHVLSGYQRQRGDGPTRASATLRELGLPVVLSGMTTATAFFALLVMAQVPMQRFGVTAGAGVLLLLLLALVVLPALLSLIPPGWFPTRAPLHLPVRWRPPVWSLLLLALIGAGLGMQMRADPDTENVFDEDSGPRRTNAFFDRHFGGSDFLQIALEGDLGEPTVLRAIRDMSDEIARLRGVVEVRSLVDPVAVLTEALGGRRGIPETPGRAQRVLTYLADHPAMAQLMTPDRQAALVHVKLAPMEGDAQIAVTDEVRGILERYRESGSIEVGRTEEPAVARAQRAAVRARTARILGRPVDDRAFAALLEGGPPDEALLERVEALRDQALDSEQSPVEGVPREEIESIAPRALVRPRGEALEALLRRHLPTLRAEDPEGIHFVAEHLGPWIDEAIDKWRVAQRCEVLGLKPAQRRADSKALDPCTALQGTLAELGDDEWRIPPGADVPAERAIPVRIRLTGQPVLGQAFADSVTDNLRDSTVVSLATLAFVLLVTGHWVALAPALWTLAITAGGLGALGHSISIGTSMVACIALGAGVDFGIHLHVRARRIGGRDGGTRAVEALGGVIFISGAQLALAFCVLLASDMPPLRELGSGLALALLGAALGAIWLIPPIVRLTRRSL